MNEERRVYVVGETCPAGGYGRGEMAPYSDVDIGFLTPFKQTSWTEQVIEAQLYTLWDLYPHADLVTYPSVQEGFGNALIEAFYFRKPVVANRYSTFVQDIGALRHGEQAVQGRARGDFTRFQSRYLIGHQRHQGRDNHRQRTDLVVTGQGWDLIAQGFAGAGGQNAEQMLAA